eukprot:TRINITY_DN7833_c0_g1_i2.p1 TRINITY_DN7833_c0_g1~~TRINITY_DN7833_c0_g1_i2.p1  ORF type:complete len:460 (+),score=141.17 TRINITY_DN7833_c0_g1_i2:44-1381(+)
MDFKLPTRKVDDDDLLEGVKRRKILTFAKSTEEQPQDATPVSGVRRLNLADAVGGMDTGIDEEQRAREEAIVAATPNTAGNKETITVVSAEQPVSIRNAEWYFLKDGRHTGPNTLDDLKELYEMHGSGVEEGTMVWAKGVIGEWMPINQVTELYAYMEENEELKEKERELKAAREKEAKLAKEKKKAKPLEKGPTEWFELKVNTSLYVYNLPQGTTPERLAEFFKKVGVIKIDPITKKPKVKVYKDNDGLVTFMKPESVKLAVDLLDGAVFDEETKHTVNVKPAEFKKKGDVYKPRADLKVYEQEMKKVKKQQEQRLGWTETDADPNARTLVIRNCFRPDDFRNELNLGESLKKSMLSAAGKHGAIDHVKVFPENEEGVITVRFKSFISAQQFLDKLKSFNNRQVSITWWDHKERFGRQEDVTDQGRGFGVAQGGDSDSDDGFTY